MVVLAVTVLSPENCGLQVHEHHHTAAAQYSSVHGPAHLLADEVPRGRGVCQSHEAREQRDGPRIGVGRHEERGQQEAAGTHGLAARESVEQLAECHCALVSEGEGDLQQKPVKGGGEGGERWGSAGRQAGSRYTREQLALRLAADCSALFSSDSIE